MNGVWSVCSEKSNYQTSSGVTGCLGYESDWLFDFGWNRGRRGRYKCKAMALAPLHTAENKWVSPGLVQWSYFTLHTAGTPSVLFFQATLPLKPATIGLKIGHLAFQAAGFWVHLVHMWFLDESSYADVTQFDIDLKNLKEKKQLPLLMEKILHHLGCIKTTTKSTNNGINYQAQLSFTPDFFHQ